MEKVFINTEFIKLSQALKLANKVESGSFAKMIILDELVKVNGQTCTVKGKKIYNMDIIEICGEESSKFQIVSKE